MISRKQNIKKSLLLLLLGWRTVTRRCDTHGTVLFTSGRICRRTSGRFRRRPGWPFNKTSGVQRSVNHLQSSNQLESNNYIGTVMIRRYASFSVFSNGLSFIYAML
jgi:hypothetical protein